MSKGKFDLDSIFLKLRLLSQVILDCAKLTVNIKHQRYPVYSTLLLQPEQTGLFNIQYYSYYLT